MDNESILFELLLSTDVPQAAQQIAASLKEVDTTAQTAAAALGNMGNQAETAASKLAAGAEKDATATRQATLALESEAEQIARIDRLIADMQARQAAARVPLQLPNTATSAETQAAIARGATSPGFTPPPLPPVVQQEEQIAKSAQGMGFGFRAARMELMGFTAAAQIGLAEAESGLTRTGAASKQLTEILNGARVAMVGMMAASMFSGPLAVITGAVIAIGALIGTLVGQAAQASAAAQAAAAALVKPFEDAKTEIDKLKPTVTALNTALQTSLGVSQAAAAGMENLAKASQPYRDQLKEIIALQEAAAKKQAELTTAETTNRPAQRGGMVNPDAVNQYRTAVTAAAQAEDELAVKAAYAASMAKIQADATAAAAAKAREVADVMQRVSERDDAAAAAADRAAAAHYRLAAGLDAAALAARNLDGPLNMAGTRLTDAAKAEGAGAVQAEQWNTKMDRLNQSIKDNTTDLNADAAAAKAWAAAYDNAVRSIAQAALTPTKVEGTDATRLQLETQLGKIQAQLAQGVGPQQNRILQQQASDIQAALTQLGPYVNKWDEYGRQLEALKQSAAAGVINPDWAKLIPADVLAKGTKAVEAWASAEQQAFYAGQRLDKIDYGGLKSAVDTQISDVISKFEMLQQAEQVARAELENLQKTDPTKYQEFLKAENLAPGTTAVDAAKKAFGDIAKGIDPAQKAASDYKTTVTNIPATVTSTARWEDKQARADLSSFQSVLDAFVARYGGVDVTVNATLRTNTVNGASGGSNGPPGPPRMASGGYVGSGLYELGEQGVEYILPNPMVKYIEALLGGPIRDPNQIGWLVEALTRGKTEAQNQLDLWAGGMTGAAATLPNQAGDWFTSVYDQYAKDFGWDKLPASEKAASGGGGGRGGGRGTGGGGSGGGAAIPILQSIDQTLKDILAAIGSNPDRINARGALNALNRALGQTMAMEARAADAHGR